MCERRDLHDRRRSAVAERIGCRNLERYRRRAAANIKHITHAVDDDAGVASEQAHHWPHVGKREGRFGRGAHADFHVDARIHHHGHIERLGELLEHEAQFGLLIVQLDAFLFAQRVAGTARHLLAVTAKRRLVADAINLAD